MVFLDYWLRFTNVMKELKSREVNWILSFWGKKSWDTICDKVNIFSKQLGDTTGTIIFFLKMKNSRTEENGYRIFYTRVPLEQYQTFVQLTKFPFPYKRCSTYILRVLPTTLAHTPPHIRTYRCLHTSVMVVYNERSKALGLCGWWMKGDIVLFSKQEM